MGQIATAAVMALAASTPTLQAKLFVFHCEALGSTAFAPSAWGRDIVDGLTADWTICALLGFVVLPLAEPSWGLLAVMIHEGVEREKNAVLQG